MHKLLVAAFALVAGFALESPAARADDPPAFTSAHLDSARTALNVMLVESGALSVGTTEAFSTLTPDLRNSFVNAPFFAGLSPARQQAVRAYFDRLPGLAADEVMRGAPALVERYTPRTAALFSASELNDIAAFMTTEDGRSIFIDGVRAGVAARGQAAAAPTFSETQLRALAQFSQTTGGRAWSERSAQFNALLGEAGREAVTSVAPQIRGRMFNDLCALMEQQCPNELRAQATPP